MSEWFALVGFIIKSIVFLVLVGGMAFFSARLVGRRFLAGLQGKYIQVLDQVALGPGRSVYLLRVGDRFLLVGSADKGVQLVASLDTIAEMSGLATEISPQRSEPYGAVLRLFSAGRGWLRDHLRSRPSGDLR